MSLHYLAQCLAHSKCSVNILEGRKDGRKGERERRREGWREGGRRGSFSLWGHSHLFTSDWPGLVDQRPEFVPRSCQIPAEAPCLPLPLKLLPFGAGQLQGIAASIVQMRKTCHVVKEDLTPWGFCRWLPSGREGKNAHLSRKLSFPCCISSLINSPMLWVGAAPTVSSQKMLTD